MTETPSTTRTFTAASFNQYLAEQRLMASRCVDCGELHLPPRALCPRCHSENIEWAETSGRGKLAGFTIIYIAPTFMVEQGYGRDKPYVSGVVELDEGIKISARITGVDAAKPETIQVGMSLNVDFVAFGEGEQRKAYLAFKATL